MTFYMNGERWRVVVVPSNSQWLARSDGTLTLGVTDSNVMTVFLSKQLRGSLLRKVLLHELTHAWMFSYNYHLSLDEEEFVCDFLASNAEAIIAKADEIICFSLNRAAQ